VEKAGMENAGAIADGKAQEDKSGAYKIPTTSAEHARVL